MVAIRYMTSEFPLSVRFVSKVCAAFPVAMVCFRFTLQMRDEGCSNRLTEIKTWKKKTLGNHREQVICGLIVTFLCGLERLCEEQEQGVSTRGGGSESNGSTWTDACHRSLCALLD